MKEYGRIAYSRIVRSCSRIRDEVEIGLFLVFRSDLDPSPSRVASGEVMLAIVKLQDILGSVNHIRMSEKPLII